MRGALFAAPRADIAGTIRRTAIGRGRLGVLAGVSNVAERPHPRHSHRHDSNGRLRSRPAVRVTASERVGGDSWPISGG
jgi:hypothetical protein